MRLYFIKIITERTCVPLPHCVPKTTLMWHAITLTYINRFRHFFGRNVAEKVSYKTMFYFQRHLTNTTALQHSIKEFCILSEPHRQRLMGPLVKSWGYNQNIFPAVCAEKWPFHFKTASDVTGHILYAQSCEKMTSSIKPEVHTILHCLCPSYTRSSMLRNFCDNCTCAFWDTRAERYADRNILRPYSGGNNKPSM